MHGAKLQKYKPTPIYLTDTLFDQYWTVGVLNKKKFIFHTSNRVLPA